MASNFLMILIGVVVAGVIGFAILDTLVEDTTNYTWVTNESDTILDNVPQTITLNNIPVIDSTQRLIGNTTAGCDNIVNGTNYTVLDLDAGTINLTTYANGTCGDAILTTYGYANSEYFDSSLSRIVVSYLVPIGLLGILAAAALMSL